MSDATADPIDDLGQDEYGTTREDETDLVRRSEDLERAIIGDLLREPDDYYQIADKLDREHFAHDKYRWIWIAIVDYVSDHNEPPGEPDVAGVFDESDGLDDIGGRATLLELRDETRHANVEVLAARLENVRQLREMQRAGQEVSRRIADGETGTDELADRLRGAADETADSSIVTPIDEAMKDWYDEFEARYQGESDPCDSTGWAWLDNLFGGGWFSGRYYLLSALPKQGKTKLALSRALYAAKHHDYAVDIWYTDGPESDCIQQLTAAESGVSTTHIEQPQRLKDHPREGEIFQDLVNASSTVKELDINLHIAGSPKVREIDAIARKRAAQHDKYMLVVDYIQECDAGYTGTSKDFNNTSTASSMLADLSTDLDCVVLGLSQFNRKAMRKDIPEPSDLRNTQKILQDVNYLAIWHRPEFAKSIEDRDGSEVTEEQKMEGIFWLARSKHVSPDKEKLYADLRTNQFYSVSEWQAEARTRQQKGEYPFGG